MMKTQFALISAVLMLASTIVPATAQLSETLKLPPGAYYENANGWQPLQHLLGYGKGREHLARGLIPTLTTQRVLKFKGRDAPVEITESRPKFLLQGSPLVGGGSARDVLIVRLDQKAKYRALPITSGATIFDYKELLPKNHLPDIAIDRISDTAFTVTPKESLKPGEYLLTFGSGQVGGYDFSITPAHPLK